MKGRIRKTIKNKKGFTLVECIVAIAILAIVCTLSFNLFNSSVLYTRDAQVQERERSEAQEMFARDNFRNDDGTFEIIYPEDFVIMMTIGEKNYYGVKRHYELSTGEIETIVVSVVFIKAYDRGFEDNRQYTDNLFATSDNRNLVVRLYDDTKL